SALFVWQEHRPLSLVCKRHRCAHEPRFVDDFHVAVRMPEQETSFAVGEIRRLDGSVAHGERFLRNWAFADGSDRIALVFDGGIRSLRVPGDRYLSAELSPRGDWLVLWGMSQGLVVLRMQDQAMVRLLGEAPLFDPEGKLLAFARGRDDGHRLLESRLFVLEFGETLRLWPIDTDGAPCTRPSLSKVRKDRSVRLSAQCAQKLLLAELRLPGDEGVLHK
ncbi:MAG: hypothetical protein NZM37_01450, partial [Sandaracinaceae bacterium]|nr:hypothetical protein [Sandaracinaceae bacterium]